MPPKKPVEQPDNQGQLFPVDVSREHPAEIGQIVEGGVFPEDLPATEENAERRHFHEVVHEQVVAERQTRNRRTAQAGRHSPLQREGTYLGAMPGDVLPGFGVITHTNYAEAKEYAAALEEQRVSALNNQPSLITPQPAEVKEAIDLAAKKLDIERGLGLPGEAPKDRELATTHIKLEALRDDSRAGFLPTTHREKTSAHELLDYMVPGKYTRGVSSRLDEIFSRQQREARKRGMTPQEGHSIAKDTVRSIIREWGDYHANAVSSWTKLDNVQELVDGIYPSLDIQTLLADQGNGEVLTQIVRYNALRQLRDTDEPLGFDPLWVREDRTRPTEEKHKTVEDMFTHQNEEFMAAYVSRRIQGMSAGQIRRGILELKHDQANRGKFWRGVIEALNDDYKEYADLALAPRA